MTLPITVFALVYLGMILGGIPGLKLDRTGVALLGALVLLATGEVSEEGAREAVDVPTLALLFGLMVVSAQLRLGGFYGAVTRRIGAAPLSPPALLAAVIMVSAILSALLTNDIVCLAMAPLLIEGCQRRGLNPLPHLLALACASNIGSAATLIGNPQNILIGEALDLSFGGYLLQALPGVVVGLGIAWAVIAFAYRRDWRAPVQTVEVAAPPFHAWQSLKGMLILTLLVAAFLLSPFPREHMVLCAAAILLISRKMHSREMMGLVDWHLLVLFISLFIVNHAFAESGALAVVMEAVKGTGIHPEHPGTLFGLTVVLSNLVSNVPAVMLLLPAATHPDAGVILALASTLAGNLFIVGSIANIIVVEQARALGVEISWRRHAVVGVPVTLLSLAVAWGLLALL